MNTGALLVRDVVCERIDAVSPPGRDIVTGVYLEGMSSRCGLLQCKAVVGVGVCMEIMWAFKV